MVKVAKDLKIDVKIKNVQNPRTEKEEHYYKVDHENLRKLGFKPTRTLEETLAVMLKDLSKYSDRVLEKSDAILPKTKWYQRPVNDVAELPFPQSLPKAKVNING